MPPYPPDNLTLSSDSSPGSDPLIGLLVHKQDICIQSLSTSKFTRLPMSLDCSLANFLFSS